MREGYAKWGDTIAVELQQPYGAILTNLKWAKMKWQGGFFVRNAKELLDDPGEFYFDRKAHMLYYMSDGEDMTQATVIAPLTEGLVRIIGRDNAHRAGNITLEGLTFCNDAWNLMQVAGSRGFGGIQSLGLATKYIPDGNWHPSKYNSCDVPDGTIEIRSAQNVKIVRNHFRDLSSAVAINIDNDDNNIEVTGNTFTDLLGSAVSVGHPQHYEIGDGEGRFAKGVEGVCQNVNISNNYVRYVSEDFRQIEAMNGFFVKNVSFTHNDIAEVPYGAISLGWWWGNAGIPESKVPRPTTSASTNWAIPTVCLRMAASYTCWAGSRVLCVQTTTCIMALVASIQTMDRRAGQSSTTLLTASGRCGCT